MLPSLAALRPTPATTGAPSPKRDGRPPPLELSGLPAEVLDLVLAWAADPDADCKEIGRLCATNRAFAAWCRDGRDEGFWRWACRLYYWDRDDRWWPTWDWDSDTGTWVANSATPWRSHYERWCGLQLNNTTIREAVRTVIDNGSDVFVQDHPVYGGIACWDTSRVTDMSYLFDNEREFDEDISLWDTSRVTTMRAMFRNAREFNHEIGDWNTSRVTTMALMFENAEEFDQDIGDWDVSRVESMEHMFKGASAFDSFIGKWDTSSVKTMRRMFNYASAFDQPLYCWDTSNVEDMAWMFFGATAFDQTLAAWDRTRVTDATNMFDYERF